MGEVTKGNTLKKDAVIKALESSLGIVTNACKAIDISRKTFYQWMKEDKEFAERVRNMSELALDFAETALLKNIKEGNPASIIFYLKTKGKERGYIENSFPIPDSGLLQIKWVIPNTDKE